MNPPSGTPHVASAAALLLSRNPNLSVTQLRKLLEKATPSGGVAALKNNDVGIGPLDLNRVP